ncbi:hypothetical protein BaRGS_00020963 [Batillaria attramentaria]|uniref:Uncharacterized protein n=1 Tax=Batillaria attramentaria TaxID=370345 RepID=A0ABD0KL81_9CAEN
MITVCLTGVVVFMAGSLTAHRHPRDTGLCNDPPIDELKRKLASNLDLNPSFYQHPQLQINVLTLDKFEATHGDMVNISINPMEANSASCSALLAVPGGLLDPCPMTYVINYDANRVPRTLMEANCTCSECQGLTPTPTQGTRPTPSILGCEPINFYTKVLRKQGCNNHVAVYVEVWEPVTVGCACRKPRPVNGTQSDSLHSSQH